MQTIPLGGSTKVALVDDEDYSLVAQYAWHIKQQAGASPNARGKGPYASTWLPISLGHRQLMMHMLITGWPLTDHIDHDGLNNQKWNLRPATIAENVRAARPRVGGTSRFKGVTAVRGYARWRARIRFNRKLINLGAYGSEIEAALAYDAAARKLFGAFAYLNFPDGLDVPEGAQDASPAQSSLIRCSTLATASASSSVS